MACLGGEMDYMTRHELYVKQHLANKIASDQLLRRKNDDIPTWLICIYGFAGLICVVYNIYN